MIPICDLKQQKQEKPIFLKIFSNINYCYGFELFNKNEQNDLKNSEKKESECDYFHSILIP